MSEPQTEAGKALLGELGESPLPGARYGHQVVELRLPAIESQARAIGAKEERERLRALVEAIPGTDRTEEGGYIIHGGMWWPQDVLALLADPEPEGR